MEQEILIAVARADLIVCQILRVLRLVGCIMIGIGLNHLCAAIMRNRRRRRQKRHG